MAFKSKKIFFLRSSAVFVFFVFAITAASFIPLYYAVAAPPPAGVGSSTIPAQATAEESPGFLENYVLKALLGLSIRLFNLVAVAASFSAGLGASLLEWSNKESFISWSYTRPDNNPIIQEGLGITQGLVNMILVLVLVYIALATILRIAGYETKKLLITFIIVALLVNFAPVFVGLIVDASNILLRFFLKDLNADALAKDMAISMSQIQGAYKNSNDFSEALGPVVAMFALATFLFVLTFVYLIFTALFVLRRLVIWLLVILAPIAFASYILPGTRRLMWDKWWHQLVQWSLVGVTAAFFLMLASNFIGLLGSDESPASRPVNTADLQTDFDMLGGGGEKAGTASGGQSVGVKGVFDDVLPHFVSLAFLGLAIVFGFSTSAMGASAITSFGTRAMRRTPPYLGKIGKKGVKLGAKAGWVGAKGVMRSGKFLIGRPAASEDIPRAGRWMARKATQAMDTLRIGRYVPQSLRMAGETRPGVEEAKKKFADMASNNIAYGLARGTFRGEEAVAALSTMFDRNDSQDVTNAFKNVYGVEKDEELFNIPAVRENFSHIMKIATNSGMHSSLLRKDPRLSRFMIDEKAAYKEKASQLGIKKPSKLTKEQRRAARLVAEEKAVAKRIIEARDQHIGNWEPETLHDSFVLVNFLALKKSPQAYMTVETKIKGGQETMQQGLDIEYSQFIDKVARGEIEKIGSKNVTQKTRNRYLGAIQKGGKSKEIWGEFDEFFRSQHGGQFGYGDLMKTQRHRDRGWEYGSYLPQQKRAEVEKGRAMKKFGIEGRAVKIALGLPKKLLSIAQALKLRRPSKSDTGRPRPEPGGTPPPPSDTGDSRKRK